ncbi:hypothetical protein [Vibrio astriarenae]|uniref:hypothetical protein n=1 Tax=Vibrio astriarenae TaxID=1481923 RepID=UPI003734C502
MKLNQILNSINQVERSKFINCIDKLCQPTGDNSQLKDHLSKIDGQLKSASNDDITKLLSLVKSKFIAHLKEKLTDGGPQSSILINILIRDGNSIASIHWIEQLYNKELRVIDKLSKSFISDLAASDDEKDDRVKRLETYLNCLKASIEHNKKNNRDTKFSSNERAILSSLAISLGLTRDEIYSLEHIVSPIPPSGIDVALEYLRECGIVFINRRRQELLIADEVVEDLHEILGKELHDKYILRILRSLNDAELSSVMRSHGYKSRGTTRTEKITKISHSGIAIRSILYYDIHPSGTLLNGKKDTVKRIIEDMDLNISRIGSTLDERIDLIIDHLKKSNRQEFKMLNASGYKQLLSTLNETTPTVEQRIRHEFEIEQKELLDPERLKMLGITPLDVLYLYTNDEIKQIRDLLGLSNRGNARTSILDSFVSATDQMIENYNNLATRNLSELTKSGIIAKEADIGSKFEEATRAIFEQLGLNVDEDLRKDINTSKDRSDIIISLENNDVIVGEVKSFKGGNYAKYSTTSRQVKAYAKRCEANGLRVAQVLIIAPSFSTDFVNAADMDADINISLLEADGLKKILSAYKSKRTPQFSPKLLTKGGLLKADLIAKSI